MADATPALTLASGSPRRIELLAPWWPGAINVHPADLDEDAFVDPTDADGTVRRLAIAKAEHIASQPITSQPITSQNNAALVLGADTVVIAADGTILGKPTSRDHALAMLAAMRGTTIAVVSGVAVVAAGSTNVRSVTSSIVIGTPTIDELQRYVDTGAADDKAGALEVQGRAKSFVVRTSGCFPNIMGLPLCACGELLSAYAGPLPACD